MNRFKCDKCKRQVNQVYEDEGMWLCEKCVDWGDETEE